MMTWHLVKETPRVMGFIGGKADKPAPISDREADAILQRVSDGADKPRPKTLFEVGEIVRVIDGLLTTLTQLLKKLITIVVASGGCADFWSVYAG